MEHLFKTFTEWGLRLENQRVLELHAGPIGVAPWVERHGCAVYLGLEINEYLAHYGNECSARKANFTWRTADSSNYLNTEQPEANFDIVFALYEVLNTYTEMDCHALVQALGQRLRKGDRVVGDVRTCQQLHGGYSITLHRSSDGIWLDEVGDLVEKEMIARRTRMVTTSGSLNEEYNCLRLIRPDQLDASFSSAGFRLIKSGYPLQAIDTDVDECRDNFFFMYEKTL